MVSDGGRGGHRRADHHAVGVADLAVGDSEFQVAAAKAARLAA
jgi:hypothetical protein